MSTSTANKKILVVDDEVGFTILIVELLKRAGYDAQGTSDPVRGLEIAITDRPDLITLDIAMPTLSGHDFLAELQRRGVGTRVIVVSAEGGIENVVKFIKGGACDYMVKPIDPSELLRRVRKALLLEGTENTQISLLPPIIQDLVEQNELNSEQALRRLHPRLSDACEELFVSGRFDDAIFNAFKLVEDRVRRMAEVDPEDIGVGLISKTMKPTDPILVLSDITSEQEAAHSLFRGAIGLFKNPHSHRFVNERSAERSFEALAFASLLLRHLDEARRHPK